MVTSTGSFCLSGAHSHKVAPSFIGKRERRKIQHQQLKIVQRILFLCIQAQISLDYRQSVLPSELVQTAFYRRCVLNGEVPLPASFVTGYEKEIARRDWICPVVLCLVLSGGIQG